MDSAPPSVMFQMIQNANEEVEAVNNQPNERNIGKHTFNLTKGHII